MTKVKIAPASPDDWQWILANSESVGGPTVVSRGILHTLAEHAGFVATDHGERIGFAILRFSEDDPELLAIASVTQRRGVGTELIKHCEDICKANNHARIWLCTTNDNLGAIRFYQRRGYSLSELRSGAFEEVKRLKNIQGEIVGDFGIPIRDELTLEKHLS